MSNNSLATRYNIAVESWGDSAWKNILDDPTNEYRYKVYTSNGIQDSIHHWERDYEASKVCWRVESLETDWLGIRPSNTHPVHWLREEFLQYSNIEIYPNVDPLAEAIRSCHQEGCKLYAYVTLFDEGAPISVLYIDLEPFPWQSRFQQQHPEYVVASRDGNDRQWGVLEYGYPDVGEEILRRLEYYMQNYDIDGLLIDTRTHSKPADSGDQFGFNDVVVQDFNSLYGVNILTDVRLRSSSQDYDPNNALVENWRELRGEYVTDFLRDLRAMANTYDVNIIAGIPQADHLGPPIGNIVMDWRTWVDEGLIDELIVGYITGMQLYPSYDDVTLHYLQIDDYNVINTRSLTSLATFRDFINSSDHPEIKLQYGAIGRSAGYTPNDFSSQLTYCDDLAISSANFDDVYADRPDIRPWVGTKVYTDFNDYATGNLNGQQAQTGTWVAPTDDQVQTNIVHGTGGKAITAVRSVGPAYINFGSAISQTGIEWSFWIRRASSSSQCIFMLGPNTGTVRVGFYVTTAGAINLYSGTSWVQVAGSGTVGVGQWVRLRMYVNTATGISGAFYLKDGDNEETVLSQDFSVSGTLTDMQYLVIAPQPGTGNTTYIDEMELFGVLPKLTSYQASLGGPTPFPDWIYPEQGVRVAQDFANGDMFSTFKSGPFGDDTAVDAYWTPIYAFDSNDINVPCIDPTVSCCSGRSLKVRRGSDIPSARTNITVPDGADYKLQYWVYRDDNDSAAVVSLGNDANNELLVYCDSTGSLKIYDNNSLNYIDTTLDITSRIWTRIRIAVDRSAGTYKAYLMADGQAEQSSAATAYISECNSVNTLTIIPQLPLGNVSHFDDFLLKTDYLLEQSFDKLAVGSISMGVGRTNSVNGRWRDVAFDANDPSVVSTIAHSGSNSLRLGRFETAGDGTGASCVGWVKDGICQGVGFEFSAYYYPIDFGGGVQGSWMVYLNNYYKCQSSFGLGCFMSSNGTFYVSERTDPNNQSWTSTGMRISSNQWTGVRLVVTSWDDSNGIGLYDAYLDNGTGWTLAKANIQFNSKLLYDRVNAVYIVPQTPAGTSGYIDDICLKYSPVKILHQNMDDFALGSIGSGIGHAATSGGRWRDVTSQSTEPSIVDEIDSNDPNAPIPHSGPKSLRIARWTTLGDGTASSFVGWTSLNGVPTNAKFEFSAYYYPLKIDDSNQGSWSVFINNYHKVQTSLAVGCIIDRDGVIYVFERTDPNNQSWSHSGHLIASQQWTGIKLVITDWNDGNGIGSYNFYLDEGSGWSLAKSDIKFNSNLLYDNVNAVYFIPCIPTGSMSGYIDDIDISIVPSTW